MRSTAIADAIARLRRDVRDVNLQYHGREVLLDDLVSTHASAAPSPGHTCDLALSFADPVLAERRAKEQGALADSRAWLDEQQRRLNARMRDVLASPLTEDDEVFAAWLEADTEETFAEFEARHIAALYEDYED